MKGAIRPLSEGTDQQAAQLDSLREVRYQMDEAVRQLDWSKVLRMDRLCAQIMTDINKLDEINASEIVAEMLKIKKLYAQAIRFLNQEILRSPYQAL